MNRIFHCISITNKYVLTHTYSLKIYILSSMYRVHTKGIVKWGEEIKSFGGIFSLCGIICKGFNRLKPVIVLKDHLDQHHELTSVHLNKRDLLRCMFSDFLNL